MNNPNTTVSCNDAIHSTNLLRAFQGSHRRNPAALIFAITVLGITLAPLKRAHATPVASTKSNHLAEVKTPAWDSANFDEATTPAPVPNVTPEVLANELPEAMPANATQALFATDFIEPSLTAGPLAGEVIDAGLDEFPAIAQSPEPEPTEAEPVEEVSPVFGADGSERWYIHAGGATTLGGDTSRFGLVGAGASHFFADGHSINLELNSMVFDQPGDDAVGLNLSAILRWHFVREADWSLYIDGGAGILGTTNDVPRRGSSFNFTPQVGGGTTIRLNDEQRLMVGLRWHHISNADLFSGNPGLDTIFGYVGLNLPFSF